MIHYLQLVRLTNLVMITLTMYCLGGYIDVLYFQNKAWGSLVFSFEFFVFTLSTVLVAAAGNVINDYYDVEADLINKPDKTIVGNVISQKKVLNFYYILNITAVLMIVWVCLQAGSWIFLLIHLSAIMLLWFYSKNFKKKLFFSNVLIAFLTASVSIQVGLYFVYIAEDTQVFVQTMGDQNSFSNHVIAVTLFFGSLAFGLNWLREVIKDMEDMEGDKAIHSRSIPIVFGMEKAKIMFYVFLGIVVSYELLMLYVIQNLLTSVTPMLPLWLNVFVAVYAGILIYFAQTKKELRQADLMIKFSMIFIILLPAYWAFYFYLL